jgi:hypothetical protein
MSWMRRSRNSVKSAEFIVRSKVIQNIAPRMLMADAMRVIQARSARLVTKFPVSGAPT